MPAAVRVVAMFGAPPNPDSRPSVTVEEFASASICKVEPMNMSIAYCPASWHSTRFDRSDPSAPLKKMSGRAAT